MVTPILKKPKDLVGSLGFELVAPAVTATIASLRVVGALLLHVPRRIRSLVVIVVSDHLDDDREHLAGGWDDAEVEVQLADESEQHCIAFLGEGLVLIKRRVNAATKLEALWTSSLELSR